MRFYLKQSSNNRENDLTLHFKDLNVCKYEKGKSWFIKLNISSPKNSSSTAQIKQTVYNLLQPSKIVYSFNKNDLF